MSLNHHYSVTVGHYTCYGFLKQASCFAADLYGLGFSNKKGSTGIRIKRSNNAIQKGRYSNGKDI
jgi:hypothetical protein